MQTSRFQLGLIATLSLGLGYTISSSPAIGYPASAVSYGESPVVAAGGTTTAGDTETVFGAASQDIVVTDLVLTSYSSDSCVRMHKTTLSLASGEVVGEFQTNSTGWNYHSSGGYDTSPIGMIQMSFASGIRIEAGDALTLEVTEIDRHGYTDCSSASAGSYGVRYALSGYHAQP